MRFLLISLVLFLNISYVYSMKDINDKYSISISGKIISKPFYRMNGKTQGYMTKEVELKAHKVPSGHMYVHIGKNNGSMVHRLVYEAYIGKIPSGYEIHHIDHNPANNHADNLALVTRGQHMRIHAKAKKGYLGGVFKNQNGGFDIKIGRKYICRAKTYDEGMKKLLNLQEL